MMHTELTEICRLIWESMWLYCGGVGDSYYLIIIMILCSLSFLAGTVDEKDPKTRFPVLKN